MRSDINQHILVMDWFMKEKILNQLRQSSDQQALLVYKEKSNSRMKYDANNCQKLCSRVYIDPVMETESRECSIQS